VKSYAQWSSGSIHDNIYRHGKVGIGTNNLGFRLHVSESGSNQVIAVFNKRGSGAQQSIVRIQSNNTTGLEFGHQNYFKEAYINHDFSSATQLRFQVRSSTKMVVQNNGNVGIGTTNPLARLSVNGEIRANRIRVMTDIQLADYVFEEDYPLMPLSEVEAFVAQHKHLPGLPSARQVKAEGLELAGFQNKLLEKIEELTLHAIAQEKRILALEQENQHLKNLITHENR